MLASIRELYQYREMINSMVRRDLRGRYKGSMLGFLWTFINPLLQLLIYTLVFSSIMRMGIEHYEIFLFVTLIPWIFFANSLLGSIGSIVYNQNLVTKIYFPREVLPLSVVTSNFVNMLYCFVIVLVVVIFYDYNLNFYVWLALPFIAIMEYILTLGLALIISAVTVYIRDMEHILNIIVFGWQFLTPVMYPESLIPEKYSFLFYWNPMAPIIVSYRAILYYGRWPDVNLLAQAFIFCIILFCIGVYIFTKLKKNFAEEL